MLILFPVLFLEFSSFHLWPRQTHKGPVRYFSQTSATQEILPACFEFLASSRDLSEESDIILRCHRFTAHTRVNIRIVCISRIIELYIHIYTVAYLLCTYKHIFLFTNH